MLQFNEYSKSTFNKILSEAFCFNQSKKLGDSLTQPIFGTKMNPRVHGREKVIEVELRKIDVYCQVTSCDGGQEFSMTLAEVDSICQQGKKAAEIIRQRYVQSTKLSFC